MNPLIIKLGGVLLDSDEALERLFTALDSYRAEHRRPLLIVHGGGCLVDELMHKLSLPVVKKNGLRVTPADQIAIITGALAGTAYAIDRDKLAGWLGFASATRNSLDSVSDRDHVLELLSDAAIGIVHLSRFAEDLIFFNTGEAGFIELSDRVTSGSSLMPQKKNPDALELIRGKCGRVQGALTGMMMTLKGLPLAYNKDMQEDKEGLFDAMDTWLDCLHMAALVLDGIQLKSPRCREAAQQGYANATELADYLVARGIPFREAHHIVGEAVVEAIRQGVPLEALPLAQLQAFSPVINDDVYPVLALASCLAQRKAAWRRSRSRRLSPRQNSGWHKGRGACPLLSPGRWVD